MFPNLFLKFIKSKKKIDLFFDVFMFIDDLKLDLFLFQFSY